jgi:hypothetical protein
MLVLAAIAPLLLVLSVLGAICDRWGPADPPYPGCTAVAPDRARCPPPPGRMNASRAG